MSYERRAGAVVIGGSVGGLLAARVLADHFGRVTIVDRDQFPAVGEQRKGVPQGRHTHGLLASGAQVIERLLPGIGEELKAAGAMEEDILLSARWYQEGACLKRTASGLEGLLVSRPLLEGMVRRRVLAVSNIDVEAGRDVVGLACGDGRVSGVRFGDGSVMEADLVVNAAGRQSHGNDWLEAIGFGKPAEDRVEVGIAYTTRVFRRNGLAPEGASVVIIPATPEGRKGGVLLAQEGNLWTATMVSHFCEGAPSDGAEFLEFARGLPHDDIYETLRGCEPVGPAYTTRFPASVRFRYEQMSRFPEGYLVFGDAICSFNPIYGQGMSTAALESEVLGRCLKSSEAGLWRRFFREASKVVDIPWSIAVGSDLRIPQTVGPRSAGVRFINWYMSKLHRAAHQDGVLATQFIRVANLLAPPPSVMHPRMVWRVLKGNLLPRAETPAPEYATIR